MAGQLFYQSPLWNLVAIMLRQRFNVDCDCTLRNSLKQCFCSWQNVNFPQLEIFPAIFQPFPYIAEKSLHRHVVLKESVNEYRIYHNLFLSLFVISYYQFSWKMYWNLLKTFAFTRSIFLVVNNVFNASYKFENNRLISVLQKTFPSFYLKLQELLYMMAQKYIPLLPLSLTSSFTFVRGRYFRETRRRFLQEKMDFFFTCNVFHTSWRGSSSWIMNERRQNFFLIGLQMKPPAQGH
jgi:hypothetical protein